MRRRLDIPATIAKMLPDRKPTGLARKMMRAAALNGFRRQNEVKNIKNRREEICKEIIEKSTNPAQKEAAQKYLYSLRNK